MAHTQFHQSLKLELSEIDNGKIAVALKTNALTAQRVSYELRTNGASLTTHKGVTHLKANDTSTLSYISFSSGEQWCVSVKVEEEDGTQYTINRGNNCR